MDKNELAPTTLGNVWGNMTHDDASVETGVGGQAKYDMMMEF